MGKSIKKVFKTTVKVATLGATDGSGGGWGSKALDDTMGVFGGAKMQDAQAQAVGSTTAAANTPEPNLSEEERKRRLAGGALAQGTTGAIKQALGTPTVLGG